MRAPAERERGVQLPYLAFKSKILIIMKIFAIEHEPFESTRISPLRKKISSAFKTAFSRVILRRKSVYDKYFADFKKALKSAKYLS